MQHGIDVARAILKTAAANDAGSRLGDILKTANAFTRTGKAVGKGVSKAFGAGGGLGEGLAEGFGAGEGGKSLGRYAGYGAVGTAGYAGAEAGKRKVDEFRYRHGLYSQQPGYY